MHYGPISYFSFGRAYPRFRLRDPFINARMRRRALPYKTAALFPPKPLAKIVTGNPIRLIRDDWKDLHMFADEIYAFFKATPSLANFAPEIAAVDWKDPQVAVQELADILVSVINLKGRSIRIRKEEWKHGKTLSEELLYVFKNL